MNRKNKNKKLWISFLGLFFIVLLTMLTRSFYTATLQKNYGSSFQEEKQAHYVMILENTDSIFWNSVYESAKEEADKQNILLELSKTEGTYYSKKERMEMSIAAKVDGIILEYEGEKELDKMIQRANKQNIPVVTISSDGCKIGAISFVGVNRYQLAKTYGEEILKIINKNTKKILVLTHGKEVSKEEEQLYNQMNSMISKQRFLKGGTLHQIQVETKSISLKKVFDVEEEIWTLFQQEERIPDILVCLNEIDTECAYQALINYNLVGKVQIIGYYYTPSILNGIADGILPSTMNLDTKQLGKYSILALWEYKKDGYTNAFYSVDLSVIDKKKAKEMLENGKNK